MTSTSEAIANWTEINAPIGKQLGYPQCCIDAFCKLPPSLMKQLAPTEQDAIRLDAAFINGLYSGFIPCYNHARLIVMGDIELSDLIKDRDTSLPPFPNAN